MTHPWKSSGSKRTIWWYYEPSDQIIAYLKDMRNAIHRGVMEADSMRRISGRIPSPIDLRRNVKGWFDSSYDYARHHLNPVCRSAVAILRSFVKNGRGKKYPGIRKLAIRLDSELVKIVDGMIRITIKPGEYEYIPINTKSSKYQDYSRNPIAEALITNRIVSLSFRISETKDTGEEFIGADLNFRTVDFTTVSHAGQISGVETMQVGRIVKIQNDFSRRRQKIQEHVRNPQKRSRMLRRTRGRQRNRVNDELHKTSTDFVRAHPNASNVLENLKGIRKSSGNRGKKFNAYLNRWPYSKYQDMVEYKSRRKTIYIDPRGTSSWCPVCGGKLSHPAWSISRCDNCDRDYDRNRLASLAILLRGLDLCGDPFPVSVRASLPSVMDEYLYRRNQPGIPEAGGTEMVNASNEAGAYNA